MDERISSLDFATSNNNSTREDVKYNAKIEWKKEARRTIIMAIKYEFLVLWWMLVISLHHIDM